MNKINKKVYEQPSVERVVLDKSISLTLDSSLLPMGDPEAAVFNSEFFSPDPLVL